MFKVRVPADFGEAGTGLDVDPRRRTEKAFGPRSGGSSPSASSARTAAAWATIRSPRKPNKPPTISSTARRSGGRGRRAVRSPSSANDDGVPKPPSRARRTTRAGAVVGRRAAPDQSRSRADSAGRSSSRAARGCGHVDAVAGSRHADFAPPSDVVKDGKASTNGPFTEPGTYVIRALARRDRIEATESRWRFLDVSRSSVRRERVEARPTNW